MFDQEPDAPVHGECAAEIERLGTLLLQTEKRAEQAEAMNAMQAGSIRDLAQDLEQAERRAADMQELCAKVCELYGLEVGGRFFPTNSKQCAAAIRGMK